MDGQNKEDIKRKSKRTEKYCSILLFFFINLALFEKRKKVENNNEENNIDEY